MALAAWVRHPRGGRARGGPGRLPDGRDRGELDPRRLPGRPCPADRPGRRLVRVGLLVDSALGRAPQQSLVQPLPGCAGRGPAGIPRADAAARRADDAGHAHAGPHVHLQPADRGRARADVLHDVPGGAAVGALADRRDRRRRVLRPVHDDDVERLVRDPAGAGRDLPAPGAGGGGAAGAAAGLAAGGHPGRGARGPAADRPGIVDHGRDRGGSGPAPLAGPHRGPRRRAGPGQAAPGRDRGGGDGRRGQPAAHRHGPAGDGRRRVRVPERSRGGLRQLWCRRGSRYSPPHRGSALSA